MQLGAEMPMIYGYKKGTSNWTKHDTYGVWSLKIEDRGVLDGGLDLSELRRNSDYEEHGLWLWCSWFIVGMLLLVTKRYTKKFWHINHYLHAALGYFVCAVTIIFAAKLQDWEFTDNLHNAFGTMTMFLTIMGTLSGTLTASVMKFYRGDKPWSEKERVEQIANIHRKFGYVMLLVGNWTCFTGINHYYGDIVEDGSR